MSMMSEIIVRAGMTEDEVKNMSTYEGSDKLEKASMEYFLDILRDVFLHTCDLRMVHDGQSGTPKWMVSPNSYAPPSGGGNVSTMALLVGTESIYDFVQNIISSTKYFDRQKTCLVFHGYDRTIEFESYVNE